MSQDENDRAVSAFISSKAEFDGLLERLAALSADHFCVSPMMFIGAMSVLWRMPFCSCDRHWRS